MANFLTKFIAKKNQLAEPDAQVEEKATIIVNREAKGVSGTEKSGGVFGEEYFRKLTGTEKAFEYDKMRRGDARVKMCLSSVKNPLRSANWNFKPMLLDENGTKHAEFLNFIFKEDIGTDAYRKKFSDLLNEAFTAVDFGCSIFERTHKVGLSHPKWGQYVGLSGMGWRSPKTIESFITGPHGELLQVEQVAYGDIKASVKMDAKWLSLITLEKEGDNYEGISLLRPCYGPWSRKQTYLKLTAIGVERLAIPIPKGKIPVGKEMSPEKAILEDVLAKLTSHQMSYITYPEGWDIDYLKSDFDPEKVTKVIQFENEEMAFAFLANFLALGSGGNGGAFALGNTLADFFMQSIKYIAAQVSDAFNEVGKELIIMNFGPQEKYPDLVADGIDDEITAEFGNLLKALVDGKMLTPDDNVEEQLRARLKLPVMREEDKGKRDSKPIEIDPLITNPEPEIEDEDLEEIEEDESKLKEIQQRILLAESKAQKKIGDAQEQIRVILAKHLKDSNKGLVDEIMKQYNDLSDANKIDAINGIKAPGFKAFYTELKASLSSIATESINDARKEVPKAKKTKLAEFDSLPKGMQKRILQQARLMATTTLNDLEKVVFLQFGDSVVSTDSAEIIASDILGAGDTFSDSASVTAGGGNTAARIVNEARSAFFFDEEVLEEIETFTFVNGDPVSPICQDLAGKTFRKDDPEADRYFPPLHHNCKSYIIPNLVGAKDNPALTPGGLKTKYVPSL